MIELISCNITDECNCKCNCRAYFPNNRLLTVESLKIDDNNYEFSYLLTNPAPSLSNIIFCIQCPTTMLEITDSNTLVSVIGNPNEDPVLYSPCALEPCPDNSFNVEYNFGEESSCCFYQGIKINLTSADDIEEIRFIITFDVPDGVVLNFQPGTLKIKSGVKFGVVNHVCIPGCVDDCDRNKSICKIWLKEKDIIVSKKDVFIYYSQSLFPIDLDLTTLTLSELENNIRLLEKLEKSIAKLNCNVAKVLEELNKNEGSDDCCV